MPIASAITKGITHYADFSGRTTREDYWWFTTAVVLTSFLSSFILISTGSSALAENLSWFLTLACLIPSLSISVRRLHDINRSGWWLLLLFTIVGFPLIAYWAVKDSDPGANDYGPAPF
jgi:uncharacterized membrane protein YhaH (DUF805 family)